MALMRADEGAHGAAIREEIAATTGRQVTPGAIYPTLDRLEARGLLRSRVGDPEPHRGGRARRLFKITAAGLREVWRSWHQTVALGTGIAALKDGGR